MRTKANVLDARCPSRQVLDLIASKWTALVIHALGDETLRYGDLRRRIGGISQKMLTQTVRLLERDGLVARKVYPVVPPMVEYRLTRLGRSLTQPLGAVCSWAERHLPELLAARNRSGGARLPRNEVERVVTSRAPDAGTRS